MKGENDMKNQMKGILITTLGASMWGLCAVAGKFVMGTKGVDPIWMVTLRLITAGLILLTIAYTKAKGEGLFEIWKDKRSVGRLIVIAVFAFAICQTSYFASIDLSNAGIATAMQQTSPIFVLIWLLLFLLGIEVGNNEQIILSLPTLGMEALSIAIACVLGSCIAAWGLWKYINWKKEEKA